MMDYLGFFFRGGVQLGFMNVEFEFVALLKVQWGN